MSAVRRLREVAAAVIVRERRVLVQTRDAPARFAGCWEFPGGGVEAGESAAQCARRECLEELGLPVRAEAELHVEEWSYDEVDVRVRFLLCRVEEAAAAEPRPLLGQELLWASAQDLSRLTFLPANARVIDKLRALLA